MNLGEDLPFAYSVSMLGQGTKIYRSPTVAGSYLSIAVVGGSISTEKLTSLQSQVGNTKAILGSGDSALISALSREDLLGDMFYAGTLGYFAEYIGFGYVNALQQGNHFNLAPSSGTYGYEPEVDYLFGIPTAIRTGGVAMDLDRIIKVASTDGKSAQERTSFNLQMGTLSSTLEHAIPEQMFVIPETPGEAISAVKALSKATAAGQRIYHLTSVNQASALQNIHHDADTMAEITSALAVGKEVVTHTDSVSVPGWSGAGYIILDPVTGDGAYKISGGENGGFLLAFIITAIALIVALYILLNVSIFIGAGLFIWEIVNTQLWLSALDSANSIDDINKANFAQVLVTSLGLVAPLFAAVNEAYVVIWFGILFSFLLTNTL